MAKPKIQTQNLVIQNPSLLTEAIHTTQPGQVSCGATKLPPESGLELRSAHVMAKSDRPSTSPIRSLC